jgi:hypothetical protein
MNTMRSFFRAGGTDLRSVGELHGTVGGRGLLDSPSKDHRDWYRRIGHRYPPICRDAPTMGTEVPGRLPVSVIDSPHRE